MEKLKDTTNQPLQAPTSVQELRKFTTTAIPVNLTAGTSTDATEVYIGDFSDMVIGIRTDVTIEVLRERYADTFQYGFLAYLRADVAVVRGESFVVLTGVRS